MSEGELTFEQQKEVDRLAKLAYGQSSNANKHRFQLYGYINELIATQCAAAKSKGVDEFFDFMDKVYAEWDSYHGNMTLLEFAHDFLKKKSAPTPKPAPHDHNVPDGAERNKLWTMTKY